MTIAFTVMKLVPDSILNYKCAIMRAILSQSQYTTTKVETQNAVLDWVQATEEFYSSYVKVNDIIQKRRLNGCSNSTLCKNKSTSIRTSKLLQLQQYMKDVLMTLLLDIDKSTVIPFHGSDLGKPSKMGQLATHAQLIKEVNQKINKELLSFTTGQA